MSLSFTCPNCGAKVNVNSANTGAEHRCRVCGTSSVGGQTGSIVPADRATRLGARVVDGLLSIPFVIILVAAVESEIEAIAVFGVALFVLGVLALIACQWYLLAVYGQTIGKKLMGIRIVKVDGGNGEFFSNVLVREIVNGFICIIPFYGLVDMLLIFADDRRCIHDHLAGTRVVKSG